MMNNEWELIELEQAIEAADEALTHLHRAKDHLSAAKGFGLWDMLGGGIFSTFLKRDKMHKGSEEVRLASSALKNFRREAEGVNGIETDLFQEDMWTFLDYWDNSILDYFSYAKISKASKKVNEMIEQIKDVKDKLLDQQEYIVSKMGR